MVRRESMNFGEKLAEYLKNNKMDQKELAELLGVKEQTISAYITKKNNPTYARFVQICTQLNIDANYFIGSFNNEKESVTKINSEDQYIIDHYKSLTTHDKEIVDHIFNMEQETVKPIIKYESIVTDDIIYFPLLKQKASAGIGDSTHQLSNEVNRVGFPLSEVPKGITHAIIIDGYSMEPIFFDGQIVFINAEKDCNDGDFGIFQVITPDKADIYCKQLKYDKQGRRYLHSVSTRASDPEFTENDETILQCIGKIITK